MPVCSSLSQPWHSRTRLSATSRLQESYKSVRAYDTCPTSPFNLSNLKGNVQVVENDLNAEDSELGFAPNGSNYILGVQRSRYGSNTFGALVELKEPLALSVRPSTYTLSSILRRTHR